MKRKGIWKYFKSIFILFVFLLFIMILFFILWPTIFKHSFSVVFYFIKEKDFLSLGSITLVTVVGWVVRLIIARNKKRKVIQDNFDKYFENPKVKFSNKISTPIESIKIHPAALVLNNFNAQRQQQTHIIKEIKSILNDRKTFFNIFELYGTEKQGKSVILWSIAEEVLNLKANHIESWCVKEAFKFIKGHEDWHVFFKSLKDYLHICRKSTIVLFWDFPFERLYSNVKEDLSIHNDQDLWIKIREEFSEIINKKIILITTSRNLHPHNLDFVKAYSSILMEIDVEPFLEKYCELKKALASMSEKKLLYTRNEITSFLKQPGIFEKYRGNMLYLLFLFENFIRGQHSISILDVLDKDTRINIDNYKSLDENNKKKETIRFVAFANLLGLVKLKGLLSEVPNTAMPHELLWIDNSQDTIYLANPFLGYYIHQEEIKANDFTEYLFNILNPQIGQLIDNLEKRNLNYSVNDFTFLRNVFHFILEEKYRPIIPKNGYSAAKNIFTVHKTRILNLIINKLLPFVDENPSYICLIREWASTLRRLGEWEIAANLYKKTLEMLNKIEDSNEKVKLLIPLARGLSSLPKKEYYDQAINIYISLLENPDNFTNIDIIQLSDQALDLFKKLNRLKEAQEFIEKIKFFDPLLHLRVGEIHENMGNLIKAEYHFRESIRLSKDALTKSRSKMNSWHKYADFLIKNYSNLNHSVDPHTIEDLLTKAEIYANELNQNVSGIYIVWGNYYYKIRKDNEKALSCYKKAADWCEKNNIPDSHAYNAYANYMIKRGLSLPKHEECMVEAETWLKKVIENEDIDAMSKKHFYNALGILVGGIKKSKYNKEIITYNFKGKHRPDYNEAIKYLNCSFESEEEQQRFDLNLKTWQDVRAHATLAELFRFKSNSESNLIEIKESLSNALKHIKAAYEGLPRFDLDGDKVKKHIINAMDYHAHLLGEMENGNYSIEADSCWENCVNRINEWEFNASKFPHICKIYNNYGWFIWKYSIKHFNDVKVPYFPLHSTNNISPTQSVIKALNLFNKALISLAEDRTNQYELFFEINNRVLMCLRALFSDAIYRSDERSSKEYMSQYLKAVKNYLFSKDSDTRISYLDIQHIKQFFNNTKTRQFFQREGCFFQEIEEIKVKYPRLNDI